MEMAMETDPVLDPDQTEIHIDIRPLGLASRMTKLTNIKNTHQGSEYF